MRIYINETIAFHVGDLGGGDDIKPYGGGTDGLYRMNGRSTGHFGSGVYISTYNDSDISKDYANIDLGGNPYKKINNNLYAIDLDMYNLYKVNNDKQGYALHSLLKLINEISYLYYMEDFVITKLLKEKYLKAKSYANILNLKVPQSFIVSSAKYMKQYGQKYKDETNKVLPSVSTLFMEMNGFNGIDVTGSKYFDNTYYGSVIYDLNKYDTKYIDSKPQTHYDTSLSLSDIRQITPENLEHILKFFSYVDLTKLSLKDTALLYKSLNKNLDEYDLDYMLEKERITKQQYELLNKLIKNEKYKIQDEDDDED